MPAAEMPGLKVELVRLAGSEDLPPPVYATTGAAGADLHAALPEPLSLAPGERALVPTGLSLALPRGYEGQVRPRSGRAVREGLTLLNTPGTIDSDYRGEVKVLVINQGREEVVLRRGDRIAQLVISPVVQAVFEAVSRLPETARDSGGFGHTGN